MRVVRTHPLVAHQVPPGSLLPRAVLGQAQPSTRTRLAYLDNLKTLMIGGIIASHALMGYATFARAGATVRDRHDRRYIRDRDRRRDDGPTRPRSGRVLRRMGAGGPGVGDGRGRAGCDRVSLGAGLRAAPPERNRAVAPRLGAKLLPGLHAAGAGLGRPGARAAADRPDGRRQGAHRGDPRHHRIVRPLLVACRAHLAWPDGLTNEHERSRTGRP